MDELDDYGIVDAHHHLWEARSPLRPNFLPVMLKEQLPSFGSMEHNCKDYLLEDILRDYKEAGVKLENTVYLECGWIEKGPIQQANETRWVYNNSTVPSGGQVSAAIIGTVNLMRNLDEVDACLKEHLTVPNFRGIRYSITHDPTHKFHNSHRDTNAYANPRFLRAMPLLDRYDLSLELWCYSHQINDAAELAAKFPRVRMVLDHFGGPLDIAKDTTGKKLEEWKAAMSNLAKNKNVYAKLSGLMAHLGTDYHTKPGGVDRWTIANGIFGQLIEYTIKTFGVDRCIWASNFPVDKANASVGEIIRANMIVYKRMGLSYEDRKKLFRDNALKFYRITPKGGKL